MFLTLNLKLHSDGEDAEEVLNLGDRKNSQKRREEKKLREEAKKEEEETPERAFSPFYSPESPRLGSHCLTGPVIAFGQPIKPFKHLHFGGSCCPSSCILHFLAFDSPLCLLFWRVLLLFLLYSS